MRAITEPKGLPLRLPFAPDKNFNHVCDLRIRNISSDPYISRAEVELTEDNFPFDKALPDGTDIAFRDDKGVTLNHNIVNWGNGSAKVNVVLDNIYNRDLRSLQMFYGKLPFPIPYTPIVPPRRWRPVIRAPQHDGGTTIWSLVVFNNKLYGTANHGKLFEWNGTDAWITKASHTSSSIDAYDATIFDNKLYAGQNYWEGLVEWNGTDAWINKGSGSNDRLQSLCVFNNKIFGAYSQHIGKLCEWNGVDALVDVGRYLYSLGSLITFDNRLFFIARAAGNLLEWDDVHDAVIVRSGPGGWYMVQNRTIVVFRNTIYTIQRYGCRLRQWNGIDDWNEFKTTAITPSADSTNAISYNDELIFSPTDGELYAWNNLNDWVSIAYAPIGEHVISLCEFDGRLFGGTSPHGQLVEYVPY